MKTHDTPRWHIATRLLVGVVALVATLALQLLGATELNIGFQGNRTAFAVSLGCFLLSLVSGRLILNALRGSTNPPTDRHRRGIVRVALGWALLSELYMLIGLPPIAPNLAERSSWAILIVVTCLTAFGSLQLRRAPRAALIALGLTAAYGVLIVVRFVLLIISWSGIYTGPGMTINLLLVLSSCAALILAFIGAWRLGRPGVAHS